MKKLGFILVLVVVAALVGAGIYLIKLDSHRDEKGNVVIPKKTKTTTTTNPRDNIVKFESNKEIYYLAEGGKQNAIFTLETKDGTMTVDYKIEDETIAKVDENGKITGIKDGETTLTITAYTEEIQQKVKVSNLIVTMPKTPDVKKPLLYCSSGKAGEKKVCMKYTAEQNKLLDEILLDRVNTAGEGTRAGAAAAARFMALEFPYRVPYFSENGRLSKEIKNDKNNYVDGEGRYYHRGLYLNVDYKKPELDPKGIKYGPKAWGQLLHSVPSSGQRPNGLDCSGFITWIIKNGGSESQDRGAGIHANVDDMTDLGPKTKLSEEVPKKNLKVGDLLSGSTISGTPSNGGHIAFVAGVTDTYVYVAESLWSGTGYFGAIIRTYKWEDLQKSTKGVGGRFYWRINLDDFYQGDGNLTNYWIDDNGDPIF